MDIRAFRGWRYDAPGDDVSRLIAPPYDVLSQVDKDALLAVDPHNIVAVDLPHVPPKQVGPDEAYRSAAERLEEWKSSGLLRQDDLPAIYAYQQTYDWAGKRHTRHMMIGCVRATELGRDIIPHEKTFPGPKADRLKLIENTRMQISPIFGFYNDPDGTVSGMLESAAAGEADAAGEYSGVIERLWPITDEGIIDSIASTLRDAPVFIADGHHRYTTALTYRDSLGDVAPDHPVNFVMFVLAAMEDPGLIILPTHRVISGLDEFDLTEFVAATSDVMDYEPVRLSESDAADADAFLKPFGPHAMAFVTGDCAYIGRLKDLSVMKQIAGDHIDAWRKLDVAILHNFLIERCLTRRRTGRDAAVGRDAAQRSPGDSNEKILIDYVADGPAALAAVQTACRDSASLRPGLQDDPGKADLVILLQATPLEAVEQIALAGAVMPHKSTYFYPKVATGMVLYSLE